MSGTARAVKLTGSPPASQAVVNGTGAYRGLFLRETAGAAAEIRVWDNAAAAAGTIVGGAKLAANGVADVELVAGVWCAAGIFVEVVAGAVEGSIRIG